MRRPDSADPLPRGGAPPRRTACVDVPELPLQLLLVREPSWRGEPAAVVAEDRPQGRVLWANAEARCLRVLPGMRYADALGLAAGLRAGVVAAEESDRGVTALAERLRVFTPNVEPLRENPGVFLLDASGLERLHPDLAAWAEAIRADLAGAGFRAAVAVGFTRFGAFAAARALSSRITSSRVPSSAPSAEPSPRHVVVFPSPEAEDAALRRVPLDRVGLPPAARDLLAKLGVTTVGAFLALPPGGVSARFGPEAVRLHRLASGDERPPLSPEAAPEPLELAVILEHPEADAERLLFLVKRLADRLLFRAAERRRAVSALTLRLLLDDGTRREDALRTAHPTLDSSQVMDLVRLRLAATALPSGAVEVAVALTPVPATEEQLRLFEQKPRRDLAAADRALARIRADLGDAAVVRASLREGHLPEAAFAWEPVLRTTLPRARPAPPSVVNAASAAFVANPADAAEGRAPPLVRRILASPLALPPRPRHEPDGWMLNGFEHGPVVRFQGPFVAAGGWWSGGRAGGTDGSHVSPDGTHEGAHDGAHGGVHGEVRREYHFAETARGHLFWIYYDVPRRRWFLQGEVS